MLTKTKQLFNKKYPFVKKINVQTLNLRKKAITHSLRITQIKTNQLSKLITVNLKMKIIILFHQILNTEKNWTSILSSKERENILYVTFRHVERNLKDWIQEYMIMWEHTWKLSGINVKNVSFKQIEIFNIWKIITKIIIFNFWTHKFEHLIIVQNLQKVRKKLMKRK